jgi:hypothetical protein
MRALLCLIFRHQRRGRSVYERDNVLRAQCRRCGAPLIKKDNHVWVLDTAPPPREEGEPAGQLDEGRAAG